MKWYKYELHFHTAETSACAVATAAEQIQLYAREGYAGVVVTDHFLNGNTTVPRSGITWHEQISRFCLGYENACSAGKKLGIDVFFGLEYSYHGTDFCTYGLTPEWLYRHPEIMQINVREYLGLVRASGGMVIQAHPFREASYIDMIRLLPRSVDAVEAINGSNTELQNRMAALYADNYGLVKVAGSDNHSGFGQSKLAGIKTKKRAASYRELLDMIRGRDFKMFEYEL